MSARDILAALSVAIVWGLTFIAIKVGVGETSPLTLAALRFLFAAIPIVVFVSPPKAPPWAVVLYGLLIGVVMVVLAAMFWGSGNVLAKSLGKVDTLALVVWSSLAAPVPLFLLSYGVEGTAGLAALAHPSWKLVASVVVISYAGTVFGFGVWARLLAHHSAATVAPFALLVPVVGMIAGAILFGETLTPIELVGGGLVMAGLALNVFGDWALRRRLPFPRPDHARYPGDPREP